MYEQRTCKVCGEELGRWVREDKEFCSATCRKRWSRRGDGAKRSLKRIMADLGVIRKTLKEHEDLRDDINDELKRIKAELTDVLRLFDRETIEHDGHKAQMIAGLRRKRDLVTPDRARELAKNYYKTE